MSLPENYKIAPYGESFIPFFRAAGGFVKELELPAGANQVSAEEADQIIAQLMAERGGSAGDYEMRRTLYLRDIPIELQKEVGDRDLITSWAYENYDQYLGYYLQGHEKELTEDLEQAKITEQLIRTEFEKGLDGLPWSEQLARRKELTDACMAVNSKMLLLGVAHNIQALAYLPELFIGSVEDAIHIGYSNQYQADILTRLYNTNEAWKTAITQRLWGGMIQQAKTDPGQFIVDMGVGVVLAKGAGKVKAKALPRVKTSTNWAGEVVIETEKGTISAPPSQIIDKVRDAFGIKKGTSKYDAFEPLKKYYADYKLIENVWKKGPFNVPVMMQAAEREVQRELETKIEDPAKFSALIGRLSTQGKQKIWDIINEKTKNSLTAHEIAGLTAREAQALKAMLDSNEWTQNVLPSVYALKDWKFNNNAIPSAEVILSNLRFQESPNKGTVITARDPLRREAIVSDLLSAQGKEGKVSVWEVAKVLRANNIIDSNTLKLIYKDLVQDPTLDANLKKTALPDSKNIHAEVQFMDVRDLQDQFVNGDETKGDFGQPAIPYTLSSIGRIPVRAGDMYRNIQADLSTSKTSKSFRTGNTPLSAEFTMDRVVTPAGGDLLTANFNTGITEPLTSKRITYRLGERMEGMSVKEYNTFRNALTDDKYMPGRDAPADIGGGTPFQVAMDYRAAENAIAARWYPYAGKDVLHQDALAHGYMPGTAAYNAYMNIQKKASAYQLLEHNYAEYPARNEVMVGKGSVIYTVTAKDGSLRTFTQNQESIYLTSKSLWDSGKLFSKALEEIELTELEYRRTGDPTIKARLDTMNKWSALLARGGPRGSMSYYEYIQKSAEAAAKGEPNPFIVGRQSKEFLTGKSEAFDAEFGSAKWEAYQKELASVGGLTPDNEVYLATYLARLKLYEMGKDSGISGTSSVNRALYTTQAVVPFELAKFLSALKVKDVDGYVKEYKKNQQEKILAKTEGYVRGLIERNEIHKKSWLVKDAVNQDGSINPKGLKTLAKMSQESLHLARSVKTMLKSREYWDLLTDSEKEQFWHAVTHDPGLELYGDLPILEKNKPPKGVTTNLDRFTILSTKMVEGELSFGQTSDGKVTWDPNQLNRRRLFNRDEYINEDSLSWKFREANEGRAREESILDNLGDNWDYEDGVYGGSSLVAQNPATGKKGPTIPYLAGTGSDDIEKHILPDAYLGSPAERASSEGSGIPETPAKVLELMADDVRHKMGEVSLEYSFRRGDDIVAVWSDQSYDIYKKTHGSWTWGTGASAYATMRKTHQEIVKDLGGGEGSEIQWLQPPKALMRSMYGMTPGQFQAEQAPFVKGMDLADIKYTDQWFMNHAPAKGSGDTGGGRKETLGAFAGIDPFKISAMYTTVINREKVYMFIMKDGMTIAKHGGPEDGWAPTADDYVHYEQCVARDGMTYSSMVGGQSAYLNVNPITGEQYPGANDNERAAAARENTASMTQLFGPLLRDGLNMESLTLSKEAGYAAAKTQPASAAASSPIGSVSSGGSTSSSNQDTLAESPVAREKRDAALAATEERKITEGNVDQLATIVADAAYDKVMKKVGIQIGRVSGA